MKKLIVFGDSFNALSKQFKGTHWSEILSERHNLELVSLARHGCSTRFVVFQILHALTHAPDSIIVGSHASSFTRVELLTKDQHVETININMMSFENFDINDKENTFLKSTNLFTIAHDDTVSDDVKSVLLNKLPVGMNMHIDRWGIFYALTQAKESNSNLLYIPNLLFPAGDLFDENYIKSSLGEKHVITKRELTFAEYYIDRATNSEFIDPGYHTRPESQYIIADKIESKLKKNRWL